MRSHIVASLTSPASVSVSWFARGVDKRAVRAPPAPVTSRANDAKKGEVVLDGRDAGLGALRIIWQI